MTKLLPCPFCGEEVEIERMNNSYIVHRCPLSANKKTRIQVTLKSYDSDEKIAEFWNKRAEPVGEADSWRTNDKGLQGTRRGVAKEP